MSSCSYLKPIALHGHPRSVQQVKYNADGDLLFSAAKDGKPTVWYTKTGERLGTFDGHQGAVWAVDANHSSTLVATGGGDQTSRVWSLDGGVELMKIEHETPSKCVGFSHDDSVLFCVTDNKFRSTPAINFFNLPDLRNGAPPPGLQYNPFQVHQHSSVIKWAEWGPTNQSVYYCTEAGEVAILDVEKQRVVTSKTVHDDEVRKVHFEPAYHFMVSCSKDGTSKLLDTRNLEVVQTYISDGPVNEATISPTSYHVITGGGTEAADVTTTGGSGRFDVRFHHTVTGDLLGMIKAHFGTINSVAFHPKGEGFTSGGEDGLIKIHHFDENYYKGPGGTKD